MLKNYKIQEICTLEKGKQIDTTCLNDSNPYQYINGGINASGYYDKYNTGENTVIVSEGGASCGYVNYVTEKFWCGCHCYKLINPTVNAKYLYYALKANQDSIMNLRSGAAMPNIKKSSFNCMDIKLDDEKDVQDKIIKSLDAIQVLIDNKNTILKSLDELVKSRFIEMFGDPLENNKNWIKNKLSEHINVIGGYAFKSSEYKNCGIPILRIGNINAGYFKNTNLVFYNEDKSLEKYKIYPNDLVLSLTGTAGKDDYGNICLMDNTYSVYYLNQRNAKIDIFSEAFDKIFLTYLLSQDCIKQKLTGKNHGIRQGNILNKDILELSVYIPPIELQNTFAEFVKQVDKSKFVVSLA